MTQQENVNQNAPAKSIEKMKFFGLGKIRKVKKLTQKRMEPFPDLPSAQKEYVVGEIGNAYKQVEIYVLHKEVEEARVIVGVNSASVIVAGKQLYISFVDGTIEDLNAKEGTVA